MNEYHHKTTVIRSTKLTVFTKQKILSPSLQSSSFFSNDFISWLESSLSSSRSRLQIHRKIATTQKAKEITFLKCQLRLKHCYLAFIESSAYVFEKLR